jgi:acyl-CoA synthetase (NDP forming)
MKVSSPAMTHKTDHGGVLLNIVDAVAARAAYARLVDILQGASHDSFGVLVQQQSAPGIELIAGMSRDVSFGPMVMFGLGGVLVEVLRDVIFRLAPIDQHEAADMVSAIRSVRILDGVRSQPPVNRGPIIDVLLRLSQLAIDFPQITEVDINPLIARGDSLVAVDARVTLGARAESPTKTAK